MAIDAMGWYGMIWNDLGWYGMIWDDWRVRVVHDSISSYGPWPNGFFPNNLWSTTATIGNAVIMDILLRDRSCVNYNTLPVCGFLLSTTYAQFSFLSRWLLDLLDCAQESNRIKCVVPTRSIYGKKLQTNQWWNDFHSQTKMFFWAGFEIQPHENCILSDSWILIILISTSLG